MSLFGKLNIRLEFNSFWVTPLDFANDERFCNLLKAYQAIVHDCLRESAMARQN